MIDRQRALEELIKYTAPPTLQPNEFTERQYREAMEAKTGAHYGKNWARDRLEREVEEGVLQKRPVLHNGVRCNAYSFANGGLEKLAQLLKCE